MKTILFLIADTGGGHRACAVSLKNEIGRLYGNRFRIEIYNIYEQTWLGRLFQRMYRSIANGVSPFFIAIFYLCGNRPSLTALETLLGGQGVARLKKVIRELNPALVVSIHPTINLIVARSLKRAHSRARSAIVITDLANIHLSWYYRQEFGLHVTCSAEAARRDIAFGMDAARVRVLPLVLDPKFKKPPTPEEVAELKREMAIPADRTVVLFCGGGEGFRSIERYLSLILDSPTLMGRCFFIVVTGNNKDQKNKVERCTGRRLNFSIYGYTKRMYELCCVSDIIVSKAGPATVMQALVLKKPSLLTWYVRPHEKANVEMIVKGGYGSYIPRPGSLIRELELIVTDERKLAGFERQLEGSSYANGAEQVARVLVELL